MATFPDFEARPLPETATGVTHAAPPRTPTRDFQCA
jgi:hypothetical protein